MATRTKERWEWIRSQRERVGISKNRMGRLIGINEQAYRRWEVEPGTKADLHHLQTFCEITGADLREAIAVVHGVTIPGYLNRPMDVLVGAA